MTKVSTITPCYNMSKYMKGFLDNLSTQTHKDLEIILDHNDPTDDTDTDGDGVGDNGDVFPNDSTEWTDTDSDGIGDNIDICPNDPDDDSDGDGVCGDVDVCAGYDDNIDTDLDGVADGTMFPYETDGLIFTPCDKSVGSDKTGELTAPKKNR